MSDVKFSYDEIKEIVVYDNLIEIEFMDGTSLVTDKGVYSDAILYCSDENIGVRY